MRKVLITILLSLLLITPAFGKYVTTENLEIPLADIQTLKIDCSDGKLDIKGVDNLQSIQVEADIIIWGMSEKKAEKFLKRNLEFDLEQSGDEAELVSVIETSSTFFTIPIGSKLDLDEEAEIRLTVLVPKDINLDISADETRIKIRNISGDLRVEGGKGKVDFREVDGDVKIMNGSYTIVSDDDDDVVYFRDHDRRLDLHDFEAEILFNDDFDDLFVEFDNDDFEDLIYLSKLNDFHSLPEMPELRRLPALPELPELPVLPALSELRHLQHLHHFQTSEGSDWLPE